PLILCSESSPTRTPTLSLHDALPIFTLALVTGMTVPDTSENAAANLAWTDIKLPKPVYAGDTLWAESEILELRESKSNPSVDSRDRKSTRLNSSHGSISYAVFCLKKK